MDSRNDNDRSRFNAAYEAMSLLHKAFVKQDRGYWSRRQIEALAGSKQPAGRRQLALRYKSGVQGRASTSK